jgi:uncharacterized 2Fe-2S/4Fe-4S cluster protein (DUF4445 family)
MLTGGELIMEQKLLVRQNGDEKEINCIKGDNLLEVLLNNGYEISTYCGGQGVCGKCKVKISSGVKELDEKEEKYLTNEEINEGIRLACKTEITGNMVVELEDSEDIEVMTSGLIRKADIDIEYNKDTIKLKKATIDDQKDYLKRVYDNLSLENINYNSLKILGEMDKKETFTVTSKEGKIIEILKNNNNLLYGVAIDIGTTTIVLYLMDLKTGREIDVFSLYNPQKKFGADVISRINYTIKNETGAEELKNLLLDNINKSIKELADRNNISLNDIYKITIVGNTIMLHTLFGIKAESIAKSPYIPQFTDAMEFDTEEIGVNINNKGIIHILPSISGYVGADIIGDLLAVNFLSYSDGYNLMIDIGTNGEIVLGNSKNVISCSAAAGPAFEGANITFGMAGIPGAISEFKFNKNNEIEYKTIGNKEPKGICGSGLLDIIAELYRVNIIKSSGAFVAEEEMEDWQKEFMTVYKEIKAFKITTADKTAGAKDILLTQKDIREVQLAKGAIAAGIEILRKELDINYDDFDNVFIAGGFGNYLDPHNACVIKMIPEELEEKIVQIGNGAGTGAKLYLLDKKMKETTGILKNILKYIELSINQDFQVEYINNMGF